MHWLRLAAPAVALAAWLASSLAPASTPQPSTPQPAAPPEQEKEGAGQAGADADEEFIPTEELQPDAAVTFPVDI